MTEHSDPGLEKAASLRAKANKYYATAITGRAFGATALGVSVLGLAGTAGASAVPFLIVAMFGNEMFSAKAQGLMDQANKLESGQQELPFPKQK
tara:strand:- start:1543 stop:1824 length:282 start_codon:yes stop_codon:yes gene_type:complete